MEDIIKRIEDSKSFEDRCEELKSKGNALINLLKTLMINLLKALKEIFAVAKECTQEFQEFRGLLSRA